MTRTVSALLRLAPGVYAAGRPAGLGTCRIDQRLTLVGVTYQERPDTDSRGTRHTWFGRPIALTDQPYIDQTYRYEIGRASCRERVEVQEGGATRRGTGR